MSIVDLTTNPVGKGIPLWGIFGGFHGVKIITKFDTETGAARARKCGSENAGAALAAARYLRQLPYPMGRCHIDPSIKIGDKVRRGGTFVLGKAFQIV